MRRTIDVDKTYTITLRPEPEGGFTVRVPAFPEIVTYGETEQEARAMAKEAIELSLEYRLAQGEELPADEPASIQHVTVSVPEMA